MEFKYSFLYLTCSIEVNLIVNIGATFVPPCLQKLSVPKKLSSHFYILGVIWTTFLLIPTWLYAYKRAPIISESVLYSSIVSHLTGVSHELSLHKSHSSSVVKYKYEIWNSVFLLLLMEAQVLRRLFESIHVFKYSPSSSMHIVGYLTGLL